MDLKQAWKKKVLSAAAGLEPAELVLKNASFVNVFTSKVLRRNCRNWQLSRPAGAGYDRESRRSRTD